MGVANVDLAAPDGARARRGLALGRPSLTVYAVALVGLFALLLAALWAYQRSRILERAEDITADRVEVGAALAAREVDSAVTTTKAAMDELAANPAISAAFAASPGSGCSLTFTGAGPFPDGHIDVIDSAGMTRCSSRTLPASPEYGGAEYLDASGGVHGPIVDPASGKRSIVIVAPIGELGVVATFLDLDSLEVRLAETFGGALQTQFSLLSPEGDAVSGAAVREDAIQRSAPIPALDWAVRASATRALALTDAATLDRSLVSGLLAALAVLIAAAYLLYRGLARPIERLARSVRAGVGTDTPLPVGGPSEVAELAEDFSTLRAAVVTELAGRRDAEDRYRHLFASNPLSMWVYDTTSLTFLDVNEAAVASYGYSRDEFLAMTIRDLRPAEDLPRLLESIATQGARDRSGPWRHLRKDGGIIEVEITSQDVSFGDHVGRFVMAEDVTERARAQRAVQRAQRIESLGQVAGGIAHDFNNLLAVVMGYADLAVGSLREAAVEDPDRFARPLHDVEQIAATGRRGAALTQQLLGFVRGEAAHLEPVDIRQLVSGLDDMLRQTVGEPITLDIRLDDGLPVARANKSQVEQVIVNLAVNSRDAMPDGGHLLIEVFARTLAEQDPRPPSHPELPGGAYVCLRVTDTGTGMAPADRDSACEPFFTTKARGSGTGLGLSTVYDIVHRTGGGIQLYSEPGLGTTVTILLPADGSAPPVLTPEPAEAGTTAVRPATVLVVDDEPSVLTAVERILTRHGHRVLTAADGPCALEVAADEEVIDLLLTDIVMPGMMGSDLADQLLARRPALRTVFMSGYAPPMLVATERFPSHVPVVDKPFTARALTEVIDGVLAAAPSPVSG